MHTLIIQDQAGAEVLRVQIKAVAADTATIAILNALKAIEPEKKTRADKGTKRPPRLNLPEKANGTRESIPPAEKTGGAA